MEVNFTYCEYCELNTVTIKNNNKYYCDTCKKKRRNYVPR